MRTCHSSIVYLLNVYFIFPHYSLVLAFFLFQFHHPKPRCVVDVALPAIEKFLILNYWTTNNHLMLSLICGDLCLFMIFCMQSRWKFFVWARRCLSLSCKCDTTLLFLTVCTVHLWLCLSVASSLNFCLMIDCMSQSNQFVWFNVHLHLPSWFVAIHNS